MVARSLLLALALLVAPAVAAGAQTAPRTDGMATPYRLYRSGACARTLILSHGLGGSETGLAGFAEGMARRGWRVFVIGHAESGPHLLREVILSGEPRARLMQLAADPERHAKRMADLAAVLAVATADCRPPQLVLAGHSMGAITTMLEAGAVARFGPLGRDRFDAYVALSPQGVGYMWNEGAWQGVRKPVLMATGTRDRSPDGGYETRLSAFEGLPPGRKRLAILPDADHVALSGGDSRMGELLAGLADDFLAGRPGRATAGIRIRDK